MCFIDAVYFIHICETYESQYQGTQPFMRDKEMDIIAISRKAIIFLQHRPVFFQPKTHCSLTRTKILGSGYLGIRGRWRY